MSRRAFTIVEVLVVMTIILVLAGLILATSSYVHNKGARSRAEAEIAAMSAALENYKADNGVYPTSSASTTLNAKYASSDPSTYQNACSTLYQGLTGDGQPNNNAKSYMTFKTSQIGNPNTATAYIKDPFGNSYGYSTAGGYNPTFDLWSTANGTSSTQWIKNW
jgi:prepilin-type N-terminal cleavage/methylation domain-containing protein